jgi:polyphosphate kinase 2 (PPK2 family)
MLEVVDLSEKLVQSVYRRRFPPLQEKLRLLQYAARDAEIPVVVVLEGWDGAGRGNIVKHLMSRLDPRLFHVHAGTPPSPLESRHHFLWRYQTRLPNDGQAVLYDHSWYGRVLVERADKLVPKKSWRAAYEEINQFEHWLADDGQVFVKFWLHISKKEQKRRFAAMKKDSQLAWKLTGEYKRHHRQYDKWLKIVEEMLQKTDTPHAPWTVVPATDMRAARVRVFQTLIDCLERELERRKAKPLDVSRTAAAQSAAKAERVHRAGAESKLAKALARKEGLPIFEK